MRNEIWFFDNRPLVVCARTGNMDVLSGILFVPIWVKFPQLPVRYWSERSLSANSSLIGKPSMTDKNNKDRQ